LLDGPIDDTHVLLGAADVDRAGDCVATRIADFSYDQAGAIVGVNVEEATRDAVAERTLAAADISELVAASATVGRTVSMAVVVSVLVAVSDADAPEAPSYGTAARYPVPSR